MKIIQRVGHRNIHASSSFDNTNGSGIILSRDLSPGKHYPTIQSVRVKIGDHNFRSFNCEDRKNGALATRIMCWMFRLIWFRATNCWWGGVHCTSLLSVYHTWLLFHSPTSQIVKSFRWKRSFSQFLFWKLKLNAWPDGFSKFVTIIFSLEYKIIS